ncbi:alpha/beta hydrolase [Mycolicibacterium arenosum]|uniref:Alpha/beta hydrolase n=1 Tax=Mycolicibacterium arenosum TaxID=2952157 RepID=A0ABT1M6B0_9MYCO|nr:alpha/beta hydrolase [Mycolicibacterium sp. CAU 1645]MCP9274706.1 alpha/beta hydrolase [Mycolicibacterium sp. CAU 1645]
MIRRIALGALTAILAALGVGVLGTFLSGVPVLGLATGFVPPVITWVVLVAVACGLAAFAIRWRHRGRYASVLVAVALAIAVGGTAVTARMVSAVENAGADIDIAETLRVFTDAGSVPDAQLAYSTFDGEPLNVSVYRPPAGGGRAPVLVYIHGGGWVAGARDAKSADMRWFADRGWLTITVDYSLSSADRHLWNVVQSQLGCALVWVANNAAAYGGDPTRLSLSGDSAGGNLAINTAYLRARDELQSSCGGDIPAVSAVTALYPAVDPADFYVNSDAILGDTSRGMAGAYTGGTPAEHPDRYAAIASATHLGPTAPPTLILVGAADHLVPVGATHRFVDAARRAGVDAQLVSVPYADHVFDARTGSIGQQAYRQLTATWLRDHGQGPL